MKKCFQEWNKVQGRPVIQTGVHKASPTFILVFCWRVSSKPKYHMQKQMPMESRAEETNQNLGVSRQLEFVS